MEGFLQGAALLAGVRWIWPNRVDFRAGGMRKNARVGGEQEKLVSVKWGTDEETDNIVKAYDPRFDLLLLEGEENNMQN